MTKVVQLYPSECDEATIDRMRLHGGSFVQKLAEAFASADPVNKQRLVDAFPDLLRKYGEDGIHGKKKQPSFKLSKEKNYD